MKARIELLDLVPHNGYMVEVGTLSADFAKEILERRPDIRLTCVDNWDGKFSKFEQHARHNAPKAIFLKHASIQASKLFIEESLDLVYIDAAHDYASVLSDIGVWWPKIKMSGFIAGHDYENKDVGGFWGQIEVKRAVDDWTKSTGARIGIVQENCPSWYARREKK